MLIFAFMGCIIFDFDGTLADTFSGIFATTQATLDKMGLPRTNEEQARKGIGLPLRDSLRIGGSIPEERIEEAVVIYRELFDGIAFDLATLFPGILEAVQELSKRGVQMAIASSRSGRSLHILMERLGLKQYIPNIFGVETVPQPKPNPDLVLHILDVLGAEPRQSLVIGDTTYDIEMGSRAGCYTCGVTWGNQTAAELAVARPDYIIDDIHQIL
jgi:haloacid dehalogenase superfamily, subfamily IA, variant 1 with third motif having Dx(3-4)D or Dx(3-4)E